MVILADCRPWTPRLSSGDLLVCRLNYTTGQNFGTVLISFDFFKMLSLIQTKFGHVIPIPTDDNLNKFQLSMKDRKIYGQINFYIENKMAITMGQRKKFRYLGINFYFVPVFYVQQ